MSFATCVLYIPSRYYLRVVLEDPEIAPPHKEGIWQQTCHACCQLSFCSQVICLPRPGKSCFAVYERQQAGNSLLDAATVMCRLVEPINACWL